MSLIKQNLLRLFVCAIRKVFVDCSSRQVFQLLRRQKSCILSNNQVLQKNNRSVMWKRPRERAEGVSSSSQSRLWSPHKSHDTFYTWTEQSAGTEQPVLFFLTFSVWTWRQSCVRVSAAAGTWDHGSRTRRKTPIMLKWAWAKNTEEKLVWDLKSVIVYSLSTHETKGGIYQNKLIMTVSCWCKASHDFRRWIYIYIKIFYRKYFTDAFMVFLSFFADINPLSLC